MQCDGIVLVSVSMTRRQTWIHVQSLIARYFPMDELIASNSCYINALVTIGLSHCYFLDESTFILGNSRVTFKFYSIVR